METIIEEIILENEILLPEVEFEYADVNYDSDSRDYEDQIRNDIDLKDLHDPVAIDHHRLCALMDEINKQVCLMDNTHNDSNDTAVTELFYKWLPILIDDFRHYNSQPILTSFVLCFYPVLSPEFIVDVFKRYGYYLTNGIVGDDAQDLTTIMDVVFDLCRFTEVDDSFNTNVFQLVFDMSYEHGKFSKQQPFVEKLVIGYMLFTSILRSCDNELYKYFLDTIFTGDLDVIGFQISATWWSEITLSKLIYDELSNEWKERYHGEGLVNIVIAMWNCFHLSKGLSYIECIKKLINYHLWCVVDRNRKLYIIDSGHERDPAYHSTHAIRTQMDVIVPLRILTNLIDYNGEYIKYTVIASKIQIALRYFGFAFYYEDITPIRDYVHDLCNLYDYYQQQSDSPVNQETMYEKVKSIKHKAGSHVIDFSTKYTSSTILLDHGICQPIRRAYKTRGGTLNHRTNKNALGCIPNLAVLANSQNLDYGTNEVGCNHHFITSCEFKCDVNDHNCSESVSYDCFISDSLPNYSVNLEKAYCVPFLDAYFPIVRENLIPHKFLGVVCIDDKLNAILMNLLLSFRDEDDSLTYRPQHRDYKYQDESPSFNFVNYNTHFGRYVLYDKVNKYYAGTGHCLLPTPMPLLHSQSIVGPSFTIKLKSGSQFHMIDSCMSDFNQKNSLSYIQPVCRSCGNTGTSQYIVRVCETLHSYNFYQFDANVHYFDKYKSGYYRYSTYKTNKYPELRALRANSNKFLRTQHDNNRDFCFTTLTTPPNAKPNTSKTIRSSSSSFATRIRSNGTIDPYARTSRISEIAELPPSFLHTLANDSHSLDGLFRPRFIQCQLGSNDYV